MKAINKPFDILWRRRIKQWCATCLPFEVCGIRPWVSFSYKRPPVRAPVSNATQRFADDDVSLKRLIVHGFANRKHTRVRTRAYYLIDKCSRTDDITNFIFLYLDTRTVYVCLSTRYTRNADNYDNDNDDNNKDNDDNDDDLSACDSAWSLTDWQRWRRLVVVGHTGAIWDESARGMYVYRTAASGRIGCIRYEAGKWEDKKVSVFFSVLSSISPLGPRDFSTTLYLPAR